MRLTWRFMVYTRIVYKIIYYKYLLFLFVCWDRMLCNNCTVNHTWKWNTMWCLVTVCYDYCTGQTTQCRNKYEKHKVLHGRWKGYLQLLSLYFGRVPVLKQYRGPRSAYRYSNPPWFTTSLESTSPIAIQPHKSYGIELGFQNGCSVPVSRLIKNDK